MCANNKQISLRVRVLRSYLNTNLEKSNNLLVFSIMMYGVGRQTYNGLRFLVNITSYKSKYEWKDRGGRKEIGRGWRRKIGGKEGRSKHSEQEFKQWPES